MKHRFRPRLTPPLPKPPADCGCDCCDPFDAGTVEIEIIFRAHGVIFPDGTFIESCDDYPRLADAYEPFPLPEPIRPRVLDECPPHEGITPPKPVWPPPVVWDRRAIFFDPFS